MIIVIITLVVILAIPHIVRMLLLRVKPRLLKLLMAFVT